ncbi:MAG: hypothetical protein A2Y10_10560 [Planctomycetes bacterium GWF2_41_51]|nr:MAG: hypothetical protein A2Y10_10560 [Planctomycetes bacterium GWF2_41_51]HBG26917.1 hypothetical protein [Phycisphaerales bacterium]
MAKKNFYLLFVIMTLINSAFGANATWQGDVVGSYTNWSTAGNWSTNAVPTAFDNVFINGTTYNPVIDNETANAADVSLMPGSGSSASLTITGGSLTVSTYNLDLAYYAGGTATVTMSGGTVTATGAGYGTLHMNRPGTERFYLNGGTINVRALTMGGDALLDISGGTLTIIGNAYNLVKDYENSGYISAYSGMGEVIVNYNGSITTVIGSNYLTSSMPWIDARDYGSFTDATITSALNAIGSSKKTLLLKAGVWQVSNSLTIPANVNLKFEQGARLFVASGDTVTINGTVEAPISQIFSGAGNVVLGPLVKEAYPQWWGQISAVDDTAVCQAALDSGAKTIRFPSVTYAIDPTGPGGIYGGLQPANNTSLIFEPGSKLKAIPNDRGMYSVILLDGKKNIKIIGATIEGERYDHLGATGEWGHGIEIENASADIVIKDVNVYNCWGDGICVGGGAPDGVYVENSTFNNNRRNACSITSAKNVLFKKCTFSNTNGTSPQKGVDIEPDYASDYLQNIIFEDCYSFDNYSAGFSFAKDGGLNTPISVIIRGCVSIGDNMGFGVDQGPSDSNGGGMVYIKDCYSINAKATGFSSTSANLPVTIDGLEIINPNQNNLGAGWERYASGLVVVMNASNRMAGNITAQNVHVESTDGKALKAVCLHNYEANAGIENIDIEVSTNMPNNKRLYKANGPFYGYCKVKFTDDSEYATTSSISAADMTKYISQTITNEGATGDITLSPNNVDSALFGNEYTFEVVAGHKMTIDAGNYTLYPSGSGNISSNVPGSKLTIRSLGPNFYIVNQTGSWALSRESGSITWNPPSLSNNTGATSSSIAVAGAAVGDSVIVYPPYDLQDTIVTGYVASTGNVEIRIHNGSGSAKDLASGLWKVKVIKY